MPDRIARRERRRAATALRTLVVADGNTTIVRECRTELGDLGIRVLSLADVGFPEPRTRPDDSASTAATVRATVITGLTSHAAVGFAESFVVDAMQRLSGIDRVWRFRDPWRGSTAQLASELRAVDRELARGGYLGPDDRHAHLHGMLCLSQPEGTSRLFEATVRGQLAWRRFDPSLAAPADCFVPDGEAEVLAKLAPSRQPAYSPRRRVIRQLGTALREGR